MIILNVVPKSKVFNFILLIFLIIILTTTIIFMLPRYWTYRPKVKESALKSNMYVLQTAVELFSSRARGNYPATLAQRVEDVLKDFKIKSNDSISVAGSVSNRDTLFAFEIGSHGPSLLPKDFSNPYDKSKPTLITTTVDPPLWDEEVIGAVFYVPLDIKVNTARGYKIYGAGKEGMLSLVLTSEDKKR